MESNEAEMRGEGYAQQTREVQTRLVADFGRWLAKRGILAQNITAELFRPYLRARARRRRPTRNDLSALQRLLELLRRQGVVAAAALSATTPAQRLQIPTYDRNVRSHLQRRRPTRRSSTSF